MSNPESRASREQINRDLRSPFLILAAIFFLAAVGFAVPGILTLLDPDITYEFLLGLSLDYIDSSAQLSWLFVRCLVSSLAFMVPLLIAVGLVITISGTFCGKGSSFPACGVKYFSGLSRVVRVILYVVSVLLALLFVIRVVRYLVVNGAQIGGVVFIFAMLLPERIFAAVVAIILYLTIRAVKSAELTADNVRLNVLSGKSESYGLKSGTVWLVVIMGIAAIALMMIHREEQAAVVCFALSALGDFLLAAWLIWYRKKNGQRALAKFRTGKEFFS